MTRKAAMRRAARELLDILAIIAFSVAAAPLAGALLPAALFADRWLLTFAIPIASLALIWALLRLRGENFKEVGLGGFGPPARTIAFAVLIAAALFAFALFTESRGMVRDLTALKEDLTSGPPALAVMILFAFVGPGLYEETLFRGFLMRRFAILFGGGRGGWILGALAQAALFGLVHGHQGAYGMLYTGGLAFVFGLLLLATGRNLWPFVLAHGLYDAARFVWFYHQWANG